MISLSLRLVIITVKTLNRHVPAHLEQKRAAFRSLTMSNSNRWINVLHPDR